VVCQDAFPSPWPPSRFLLRYEGRLGPPIPNKAVEVHVPDQVIAPTEELQSPCPNLRARCLFLQ